MNKIIYDIELNNKTITVKAYNRFEALSKAKYIINKNKNENI